MLVIDLYFCCDSNSVRGSLATTWYTQAWRKIVFGSFARSHHQSWHPTLAQSSKPGCHAAYCAKFTRDYHFGFVEFYFLVSRLPTEKTVPFRQLHLGYQSGYPSRRHVRLSAEIRALCLGRMVTRSASKVDGCKARLFLD